MAKATNSTGAAVAMTAITVVISWAEAISAVAAASRQAWSFARDSGQRRGASRTMISNMTDAIWQVYHFQRGS